MSSSLLGSIFGNEAVANNVATTVNADLFGGGVLLPPPIIVSRQREVKKKTSSSVNNDSDDDADEDEDDNDDNYDDDDNDDEPKHKEEPSSTIDDGTNITTTTVTKTKQEIQDEIQNKLHRTIFVGNLPPYITRKALASLFASTCGKVESARLRSIPVTGIKLPPQKAGNQKLMRKVCINTGKVGYVLPELPTTDGSSKKMKTETTTIGIAAKTCAQGYVVFEKLESVQLALSKNNTVYDNRTIRVDRVVFDDNSMSVDGGRNSATSKNNNAKNSVFVGNLPYGADEETLRQHFMSVLLGDNSSGSSSSSNEEDESASIITGVRIIRDSETQQCKGFGYIALQDGTYIADALRAHGTVYMKRELRVMICGSKGMKKGGSGGSGGAKSLAGRGGGSRPRTFDGQRTTLKNYTSTSKNNNNDNKRKFDDGVGRGSATKKRRARSEKKTTDGGGGKSSSSKGERLSKRAATEARVKKRVKKLQQRVVKGMGKKKK
jgi:nucleolar protein 12